MTAVYNRRYKTLFLSGPISEAHTRATFKFTLELGDGLGLVFINSEGGDEMEGFAVYDLLRPFGPQLTAVAVGQVQSSAVLPYLACDTRLTGVETAFMFHHGTHVLPEPEPQLEVMNIARELKRLDTQYMNLIVRRTKIRAKDVERLTRFGHYFDAKEAVKNGFAHGYSGRII